MSPLTGPMLNLYYHATRPWRAWYGRRAAAEGRCPLAVIFYHRVADDRANSWTISSRGFVEHLDWLQERCELVSLEEIQRRMRFQDSRRPAVSITFDDGYAENCREAIPLLVRRKIPCTYFVTVRNVIRGEPFPHDVARGQAFPPNTLDQLRVMADAGIEIGVHGYTHCRMSRIGDPLQLYREIVTAGQTLQEMVGRRMRYFSFPFGLRSDMSDAALELAWQAGYEAVCTACGAYNLPGGDAFLLSRIHGEDGLARLRNWITIDPRKLYRRPIRWTPPQAAGKELETSVP